MSFFKWSKTANNNANADGTINWAEGQAPSTVNDSARAMMAAAAKYRDDIAGVTTGGTATAYTWRRIRHSIRSPAWTARSLLWCRM